MDDGRCVKKLREQIEGKRKRGRPRRKWIEAMRKDLRGMEIICWKE